MTYLGLGPMLGHVVIMALLGGDYPCQGLAEEID